MIISLYRCIEMYFIHAYLYMFYSYLCIAYIFRHKIAFI